MIAAGIILLVAAWRSPQRRQGSARSPRQ
jgi:hypothetical protein